jgi:hypothetical protein
MSLSTILEKMNQTRPTAEMDVTMGNPQTYNGRVGLKRASVETMKRLRLEYRNKVMETVLFIVVTGPGRDKFTEVATSDSFGCFASDPDSFFKDLTSRIDPKLFGRESAKHLFSIAENVLMDKAQEIDIASTYSLRFSDKYNTGLPTAEEFTPLIRNAISDQIGSEIVGINAVHSIVDAAINKGYSQDVTPIVLSTSDEKFALDLQKNLKKRMLENQIKSGISDKVFLVVAGKSPKTLQGTDHISLKNVTEETVADALAKIKDKI